MLHAVALFIRKFYVQILSLGRHKGKKVVANKASRSPLNLDGKKGSQRAIVLLVH
jgi:hypothetical protein